MHLVPLLLFILTTLGNTVLFTISLNLIFHQMTREWVWTMWVVLHGIAIIAIPAWILFRVYLRGLRLMYTGELESLPTWAIIYTALALSALAYCVWFILRARRSRRPDILRSNHTQTIDIAADLGAVPTGPGLRGWIARLPLNDLFKLELSEKHLVLPGLPREWDGLSILHVTDVHLKGSPDRAYFERAIQLARERWTPDIIALTGDLLDDPALVTWIAPTLGQLRAPLGQFFILGNHDAFHAPDATRAILADLGWTDLSQRHLTIQHKGLPLMLAGTEHPWIGQHPALPGPAGEFRLLLAHAPHSIAWARRQRFDLVLAGHLHGGQVQIPPIGAIIGGHYAAGTFYEPPTAMHVSKGLGTLTPIRLFCPPDLTLLTLHASEV